MIIYLDSYWWTIKIECIFRECPTGHAKNEQTGNCDDINECEGPDVTCNLDTQVCYNVPGSYKCLDILSVNQCPNGFKFDPKIKHCIGKRLQIFSFWFLIQKSNFPFIRYKWMWIRHWKMSCK